MAIDKIVAEYRLELDGLRQDVNALKGQLKSVDDSVKQSTDKTTQQMNSLGEQVNGKLSAAFTKLGGAIAAAFAVERIGAFISQSIELAAKAEGIKSAFDRLNDPTLLRKLQQAVNGTVGDIELMQAALRANNFKIPLQDLTNMFKFAKTQSDLTGRSVTELANTIIDSIGKGSVKALNELGVKQEEINAAVVETGSVYAGSMKIINDGLAIASEQTETFSDKQAQLRVQLERTQTELGEKLLPAMNTLVTVTEKLVTGWSMLPKYIKLAFDFDGDFQRQILNNKKAKDTFEEYMERVKEFSTDDDIRFFTRSFTDDLKNQTEAIRQNMLTADASTKVVMQDQIDTIQNLIKYINNYRDSLIKTDETTTELGTGTKETTNQIWGLGQALLTLAKHALDASDAMGGQGEQSGSARAAFGVARTEAEKLREELVKLSTVTKDGLPNATEQGLTESAEHWTEYGQQVMGIIGSLANFIQRVDDSRLENLQQRLEQGLISQQQYDDAEKKILEDKARRDKLLAIFDITLATARGIAQAIPNPLLIAFAAAQGAIQLGTAAALGIPAFKDGVIDFKGKGTGTSDSNLALISRGESVITAKATRKHKDVLEAIQKDKFDEYVMQIYAKQIREKQKDGVNHELQELLYRQLLISNKQIKEDKENTKEIVSAIEKRPHRF